MVDQGIIDSFHMMWDNFPVKARLIQKDRTVVAVNKIAAQTGFEVGVKCIDTPPVEAHRGCLANKSLADREGKMALTPNGERLRFWVPVEGSEDLFVHFSISTAMDEIRE